MPKKKLNNFPSFMPDSKINFLAQSEQSLPFDIVDELFDQNETADSLVDSQTPTLSSSTSSVDQRLLYWKMMLKERRAMQKKLRLATGKQPEQLLFHQASGMEHRSKETMKRLLDKAQKVDPNAKTYEQKDNIEFIAVPRQTNFEILGTESPLNDVENKWLRSKVLEDHVDEQFSNIEKIIEFYPDCNNLEIIGQGIPTYATGKLESLHSITSTSAKASMDFNLQTSKIINDSNSQASDVTSLAARSYRIRLQDENPEVGLLINGMPYRPYVPEFSPNLERMFVCNPFENILRTVMRIENVGREAIRFSWMQADFFAYNNTLFEMLDNEFIFDTTPFQLRFGEIREITVLFRPRKVSIVKQRWLLMTRPQIFFRRPCALTLNMHGRCTASAEYTNLLMEHTLGYIHDLHRSSLIRSLKRLQVNVIKDSEHTYCPYQRQLEEREAFNQRNKGFNCATFDDMESLKDFYQRIKPGQRYPEWDYSVRWLINLICQHNNKKERIEFFKDMQNLLERLRGRANPISLGDSAAHILERERTKFLYVKGLLANNFEMLEEKIYLLEKLFIKQRLQSKGDSQLDEVEQQNPPLRNEARENQLWHCKYFRKSIYNHAYNILCNMIEDLVSVIESTELV